MALQRLDQLVVAESAAVTQGHPLQASGQIFRIGSQFPSLQVQSHLRLGSEMALIEGWLSGRAKQNGNPVIAGQFVHRRHAGLEQRQRQGLSLIQDDDAVGQMMQLAAARGAVGEQAFEQLHVGGENNGRRPILHRQTQLILLFQAGRLFRLNGAVMLQNDPVPQNLSENGGGLIDHRGKGNGVDDPL